MNPPDKVTADARELAERICQLVRQRCATLSDGYVEEAAAVLAPVLARAEAAERERDQLRAEVKRLTQSLKETDPIIDERNDLRVELVRTIRVHEAELAALRAQVASAQRVIEELRQSGLRQEQNLGAAQEDTADMDWLELQSVKVSTPLRYGSKELFCVAPFAGDGEEQPSRLREAVRAARREGGAR